MSQKPLPTMVDPHFTIPQSFKISREIQRDGISLLTQVQQQYGDLVHFLHLPVNNYLVASPEIAYEILVKNAEQFEKPALAKRLLQSSFGNGLFFSEGDFWKRQRKLAQSAFHHGQIKRYSERIVQQAEQLTSTWSEGGSVDMGAAMHALTLKVVVDALFKTDISSDSERIGAAMNLLGQSVAIQTTNALESMIALFIGDWVPIQSNRMKKEAVSIINESIYRLISDHRAGGADQGDLLSMFIEAKDDQSGAQMTDSQIRDELMTMFIAGHETSAVSLTWIFVELARHPEIVVKLHDELGTVLEGRSPTMEDLPNLSYTLQIIKEALRLYTPVVFISRTPKTHYALGGEVINRGALLNIVPYLIHRDAQYYPEPEVFRPERWTLDFEKNLPKCAYIPFGSGPRVCIGNGFAMLEMQLALAVIAQKFDFTLEAESIDVRPKFAIVLGFDRPVMIKVRAHQPDAKPVTSL